MLGRFRSAIYNAIGTIDAEPGAPVVAGGGPGYVSSDGGRAGKVRLWVSFPRDAPPVSSYFSVPFLVNKIMNAISLVVWRWRRNTKYQPSQICIPKTYFPSTLHG